MKLKYILPYVAVAIAFAAVSLWVLLSGGRSAKAVRAKFRLGGIMLSLSGLAFMSGCGAVTCYDPVISCYDVAMTDVVTVLSHNGEDNRISVGDSLLLSISERTCISYSYTVMTESDNPQLLQSGDIIPNEDGACAVLIAETSYRGKVTVCIYGKKAGQDDDILLMSYSLVLV